MPGLHGGYEGVPGQLLRPCGGRPALRFEHHLQTHTHTHTAALVGGNGRPFGGKGNNPGKSKKPLVCSKFYPQFDDSSPPDAETFRELHRVSKKLIIWGGNYFLDYLGAASCMIVWDKKRRGMDQADCEIAWTNLSGQSRIFEYRWNGMLQENMAEKETRIHATQKPVDLYRWLFNNYAKSGDKVLDPFLGSGSSRIAAYDAGLDFWGYEIDKTYFDLQEKRFADYTAQTDLFHLTPDGDAPEQIDLEGWPFEPN